MATATLTDNSSLEDVTLCFICFEKFKTPRYLPCSHSFCHDCLSSHIVSVCKSTELPLGFNCPLCREYIPIVSPFDRPEEWAGTFPVNEILEKILKRHEQKLCDSCLRDNEEEDASDFCLTCMEFLCKTCTKCHRKLLLSKGHNVCSLNKISIQHIQSTLDKDDICKKHQDQKLNLYCYEHEEPCCIVCGGTEHRQCYSVDAVDKAAQTYKESGKFNKMLQDVISFRQELQDAKKEQENNITELETTLDKVTEDTEKECNDIIQLIERLKMEHLDECSAALKEGKEMLTRSVVTFSDGIQCADFCSKMLEKAKEKQDGSTLMTKFSAAKVIFQNLKIVRFRTRKVQIKARKEPIVNEMAKMKKMASVALTETVHDIPSFIFDVSNMQLHLITEFSASEGNVRSGTWLSNKTFIFSDGKKGRVCYWELSTKDWKLIESLQDPFGILEKGDELFVTCKGTKSIEVFSMSNFKNLRSINLDFESFGISSWREEFYLACGSKIVKIDNVGNKIKEFNTQGSSAFNILTTKSGIIVYTDVVTNKVSAISEQRNTIWDYTSPELKYPYGLDRDSRGNIYVAGIRSHNIHVISNLGEMIRIFSDIKHPIFMKIDQERNICCVCSNYKTITFYEMK